MVLSHSPSLHNQSPRLKPSQTIRSHGLHSNPLVARRQLTLQDGSHVHSQTQGPFLFIIKEIVNLLLPAFVRSFIYVYISYKSSWTVNIVYSTISYLFSYFIPFKKLKTLLFSSQKYSLVAIYWNIFPNFIIRTNNIFSCIPKLIIEPSFVVLTKKC